MPQKLLYLPESRLSRVRYDRGYVVPDRVESENLDLCPFAQVPHEVPFSSVIKGRPVIPAEDIG